MCDVSGHCERVEPAVSEFNRFFVGLKSAGGIKDVAAEDALGAADQLPKRVIMLDETRRSPSREATGRLVSRQLLVIWKVLV